MKHVTTGLAALLALAACDQPGNTLSDADRTARTEEAAVIAQYPSVAGRKGDVLTLAYDGKAAATYSDGDGTCARYLFTRTLRLRDDTAGRYIRLPQVLCRGNGADRQFVVASDGQAWDIPTASAAPQGQLLAAGSNRDPSDAGLNLTVYEWPSRQVLARFAVNCRTLDWQDNAHFNASCVDGTAAAPRYFNARVWRDEAGQWQLQGTRWLKGDIALTVFGDRAEQPGAAAAPTYAGDALPKLAAQP